MVVPFDRFEQELIDEFEKPFNWRHMAFTTHHNDLNPVPNSIHIFA